MLSAFHPISPLRSVELVEAAGVPNGRRLIADFAAAGLIKSYALTIETIEAAGGTSTVRDSALAPALWQRIIHEDVVDDVWTGGTVRLRPTQPGDGEPEVRITGIRFNEKSLQRLVDHHCGTITSAMPPRKVKPPRIEAVVEQPVEEPRQTRRSDPVVIDPDALMGYGERGRAYNRIRQDQDQRSDEGGQACAHPHRSICSH